MSAKKKPIPMMHSEVFVKNLERRLAELEQEQRMIEHNLAYIEKELVLLRQALQQEKVGWGKSR